MPTLHEQIGNAIKPPISPKEFRVYVFGPGLQPDEDVQEPPTSNSNVLDHAKYLRFATKRALEAENFTVDFGETREVLEFWEGHFLAADPGSQEFLHANHACSAIVMFPASVGAICELGLFTRHEPICTKTCIIVHTEYENQESFFRRGLVEVFEQTKGLVRFKDYLNHTICTQAAVEFVRGRFQALLREKNSYDYLTSKHAGGIHGAKFRTNTA